MKQIAIFDTSISNGNLGNQIIVDAVRREVKRIFPHDFVYQIPPTEFIEGRHTKRILNSADFVIYAGTNVLRSDMDDKINEWCIRPTDQIPSRVVLLGAGWWQYQSFGPNKYTKNLLHNILHQQAVHSVRDRYTMERLVSLGLKAENTGCPTIWDLTPDHCASIPAAKSEVAITTLTQWKADPEMDRRMLEDIKERYQKAYFWPQMFRDYEYLKYLSGNDFGKDFEIIDPTLEAYDEALRTLDADFIGNRLHGGIRAMQHGRRAIIVAIDNRANEMGRDFNLPVCPREDIASRLGGMISSEWKTEIRLNNKEINDWRGQFQHMPGYQQPKPSMATRIVRKIKWSARKALAAR